MTDAVLSGEARTDGSRHTFSPFRVFQAAGFVAFFLLCATLGREIVAGSAIFGILWLIPVAIAAYAIADLVSGIVHFLADNFGSPETPVFGPAFIKPFRDHHTDPTGILHHPFMIANGNNCLVALPPLAIVWITVPTSTTFTGYLTGSFALFLSLAVFLTNQFHKWAHMDSPPPFVAFLQRRGVILSREHHDVHHTSPFDTYYCITAGWWNPLLERTGVFEKTARLIIAFRRSLSAVRCPRWPANSE